jgi:hypothetical protein
MVAASVAWNIHALHQEKTGHEKERFELNMLHVPL